MMTEFEMPRFPEGAARHSVLALDDVPQDAVNRFTEGFQQFMTACKKHAVVELLNQEFPRLVGDENFVQHVACALSDAMVEEKRYVFLSLNPKFSA